MAGVEHYFSPDPGSRRRERTVTLELADISADLRTDRGVFSAQRVDPGTRLLLKHAPLPGGGAAAADGTAAGDGRGAGLTLADVGCGYGPIAVALALRAPGAAIWAVDVNQRARSLAAANLVAAGVTVEDAAGARTGGRARVCSPGEVPESLQFDGVYCNPPVRIGNKALDNLLLQWLQRLQRDGFAVVVMHKNLGADSLVRRLAEHGWTSRRLATGGGYRVLQIAAAEQG